MFDVLSDKLQSVLSDVRSRGKLSEEDVNKAMREIRLALARGRRQLQGRALVHCTA